jgi:hypothetical protein
MTWAQGEERPRRLQLSNGTEAPVSVWLDNCLDHYRLGDVPPGKRWALELPDRLVPYSNQLHLHVYDLNGLVRVGSYAIDVEPKWTLSLEVEGGEWVDGEGREVEPADRFEGLNGFLLIPGPDLSYASRWAEDTPAVLTWQCLRSEPMLTLTFSGKEEGTVPVEVTYLGMEGSTSGLWKVYQGRARGVRPPTEVAEEITSRAMEVAGLELTVGQGENAQRHTFLMNGFQEARRVVPCFGGR